MFDELNEILNVKRINSMQLIYKSPDEATAKYYKYVMYGPVLTVIGSFGLLGNTLSIIVFTRSCMKNALNFILVGKGTSINDVGRFSTLFNPKTSDF